MELYELLSTAVADLPDLPDLLPEVQRRHRRRVAAMRNGTLAAAALLAVGAGTLAIAAPWGRTTAPTGAAAALPRPAPDAVSYTGQFGQIPPGNRPPAPELTGENLSGSALHTSYTGHVTVLETWGSWCTPCAANASALASVAAQAAAGVVFYGIDERDDGASFAFQQRYLRGISSFQDPDGHLLAALSGVVLDDIVPATVIVDANGQVAATVMGTATSAELKSQIAYAEETG
jgi:thiol-disulfide isomerase/thioredoxin